MCWRLQPYALEAATLCAHRFLRVCLAQLEPHRDVALEQAELLADLTHQPRHVLALQDVL